MTADTWGEVMLDSGDRLREYAARFDHLLRLAMRSRSGMLTAARASGLNEEQLETGDVDALEQIALAGERSMSDLAQSLAIDPSTATRAVDRLVRKGLVCRHRSERDARVMLVALTEAGIVTQAEAAERRTAMALRLVKRFVVEDQQAIEQLWPQLATAIGEELDMEAPTTVVGASTRDRACPVVDDRQTAAARAVGRAWQVMRRSRTGVASYATTRLPDLGLEAGDINTLDQITTAGGIVQMSHLAAALRVTSSSATKAVGRLAARDLATRTKDPNDGRVYRVSLTAAGKEAQAAAYEGKLRFATEVLKRFEPEDRETLGRLFPLMADAVKQEFGALRRAR